jgi:peptide/nickel transport system substrate-binding protein
LKGEVDLLENPGTDLVSAMEAAPQVTVAQNDPLGYQLFMAVNHLHPPFDKKEARQALMLGVKQADFLASAIGDPKRWKPCYSMFGCGTPSETSAGAEPLKNPDPARAAQMLKAAGYDGRPLVVLDPTDVSVLHGGALMAKATLEQLGAKVDLNAIDWSTMLQRRASKAAPGQGGWSVFVTNATVTGITNPLLHTFVKQCDQAWYGWSCDPRIVELNRAWALETDVEKRKALTDEIQRRHLENVSYIPLGQYQSVIAYRKELKGILPGPALFYWNVEKG